MDICAKKMVCVSGYIGTNLVHDIDNNMKTSLKVKYDANDGYGYCY